MAEPGQCRIVQHCVNRRLNVREDTREISDIEILLTPAEELHFARTVERLHMSVARVSQAIRSTSAMSAPPLQATSRAVRLTPVGEQPVLLSRMSIGTWLVHAQACLRSGEQDVHVAEDPNSALTEKAWPQPFRTRGSSTVDHHSNDKCCMIT
ncbi:LysR family transcriptional regulator [Nonomuraea sp. NPDC049695]|uniref:helix-turn-helix domain-containing protein n=1 Tax=Nonomuraea sp. NPDC049695 TaxID=3154734 RepID=UPI003437C29D